MKIKKIDDVSALNRHTTIGYTMRKGQLNINPNADVHLISEEGTGMSAAQAREFAKEQGMNFLDATTLEDPDAPIPQVEMVEVSMDTPRVNQMLKYGLVTNRGDGNHFDTTPKGNEVIKAGINKIMGNDLTNCIRCGKPSTNVKFYGGLCMDCADELKVSEHFIPRDPELQVFSNILRRAKSEQEIRQMKDKCIHEVNISKLSEDKKNAVRELMATTMDYGYNEETRKLLNFEQQFKDSWTDADRMELLKISQSFPPSAAIIKDGSLKLGYNKYDDKKYNLLSKKLDVNWDGVEDEDVESDWMREYLKDNKRKVLNIFDHPNKDFTINFCNKSKGNFKFAINADMFLERKDLMESKDCQMVVFKDQHTRLLSEKNKVDIMYRWMPQNNIWVEEFLEYNGIYINGIHLMRVWVKDGDKSVIRFAGEGMPPFGFHDGISIFFAGLETNTKNDKIQPFYSLSLLDETADDVLKNRGKYYCPICNQPMIALSDTEYACEEPRCVPHQHKITGGKFIYDVSDPKVKKKLADRLCRNVLDVQTHVNKFVCNLLDFLTNPEVEFRESVRNDDALDAKREKDTRKGRTPQTPVRVIAVTGHLLKYINNWREKYPDADEMKKYRSVIDGFRYRFWSRTRWKNIYSWIAKCKTDEEIVKRLAEWVRVDEDDHPLPSNYQWQWDRASKVVFIWKLSFVRNKDCPENPRKKIKQVEMKENEQPIL